MKSRVFINRLLFAGLLGAALASCTGKKEASNASASNVTTNGTPQLGDGWNLQSGELKGTCLALPPDAWEVIENDEESEIKILTNVDAETLTDTIDGRLSAGLSGDTFAVSGGGSYFKDHVADDYSLTYTILVRLRGYSKKLKDRNAVSFLPSVGPVADVEQIKQICGDTFVTEQKYAGGYMATMKLNFKTRSDYERVAGNLSIGVSSFSLNGNFEKTRDLAGDRYSTEVSAQQLGGDVAFITSMYESSDMAACQIGKDVVSCAKVFEKALKYAQIFSCQMSPKKSYKYTSESVVNGKKKVFEERVTCSEDATPSDAQLVADDVLPSADSEQPATPAAPATEPTTPAAPATEPAAEVGTEATVGGGANLAEVASTLQIPSGWRPASHVVMPYAYATTLGVTQKILSNEALLLIRQSIRALQNDFNRAYGAQERSILVEKYFGNELVAGTHERLAELRTKATAQMEKVAKAITACKTADAGTASDTCTGLVDDARKFIDDPANAYDQSALVVNFPSFGGWCAMFRRYVATATPASGGNEDEALATANFVLSNYEQLTIRYLITQLGKDPKNVKAADCTEMDLTSMSLKTIGQNDQQGIVSGSVVRLEPVASFRSLQSLYLQGAKAKDLRPLEGLKNLKVLDLTDVPVEDVGPLANIVTLQKIYLAGTDVKSIDSLLSLPKLVRIKATCANLVSYPDADERLTCVAPDEI